MSEGETSRSETNSTSWVAFSPNITIQLSHKYSPPIHPHPRPLTQLKPLAPQLGLRLRICNLKEFRIHRWYANLFTTHQRRQHSGYISFSPSTITSGPHQMPTKKCNKGINKWSEPFHYARLKPRSIISKCLLLTKPHDLASTCATSH